MTTNERNGLKNLGSSNGLKTSGYNSSVQFGNNNHVKHIDYNRTQVNGTTYYGASNARKALNNLK